MRRLCGWARSQARISIVYLAFALPFAPWPLLVWFSRQASYSTGRHSATALFAVAGEMLVAIAATSFIGMLLILVSTRDRWLQLWWLNVAGVNAIAMWLYLESNAAHFV